MFNKLCRRSAQIFSLVLCLMLVFAVSGVSAQDAIEVEFWDMVWGPSEYPTSAEELTEAFNEGMAGIQVG